MAAHAAPSPPEENGGSSDPGRWPGRRYAGIFVVLAVVAGLFWWSHELQESVVGGTDRLAALLAGRPLLGPLVFVALAATSAMASLFSSVPLVPVAVLLWGERATFAYLLTGWMLGGVAAYLVGASLHGWVRRRGFYPRVAEYRGRLQAVRLEFPIVLLFRLAMPAEIPGYVLGGLRYPFALYLLVTFLSELPVAAGAVWASQLFLARRMVLLLVLAVAAVVLLRILFELLHRALAASGSGVSA